MSAPRYERLRAIFRYACDLPSGERTAYLDEACHDDPDLRRKVDELLDHDSRPIEFVGRALVGGGADVLAADLATGERPERVGPYRIVRVIGEGGMGMVYEAEQEDPRRRVALKVIRPAMATPALLRRFRHEAHVLGQLRHPGIAQIFEAGTTDRGEGGQPFFAMELVGGMPLLDYAREHDLGVEARLRLFARVCDALDHAHRKGVIHRDLKPENILVETDTGRPKVLDFGVARATDADLQTVTLQTGVGQLLGTVPYMSPEQASGDPSAIDARSDIYALGVILFQLLAGKLPYPVQGKLIHEAVRVIQEEDASRLSSVSKVYRGDIETIVAKALEKDKARRYQSAAALAADLRRHLHDQPIVARPASALYQIRKFARRNRALAAGMAIAFLAMVLATTMSLWQARAARLAEAEANRQHHIADARWDALYESAIDATLRALDYGEPTVALAALDATGTPHPGAWEYRYLAGRLDSAVVRLECDAPLAAVAYGADGTLLTVERDGHVRRWDVKSGELLHELRLDASAVALPCFSRDRSRLAAAIGPDQSDVAAWDLDTGRRLATLRDPVPRLRAIAISTDGGHVVAGGRGTVLWDVATGDLTSTPPEQRGVYALAFSGDGGTVVSAFKRGRDDGRLYLLGIDAETGSATRNRIGIPYTTTGSIAVTADGSRAIAGLADESVRSYDMDTGEEIRLFSGHTGAVTAVALDRAGRRLVTGSEDRTVRVWDLETGEPTAVLTGSTDTITDVAFSADGSKVAAAAGPVVRIFDLAPHGAATILSGHRSYVYAVGFGGPDARIVSGAWDGDVRDWDATGACLAVRPTGRAMVSAMAARSGVPMVATGHSGGRVRLWDRDGGEMLREMRGGAKRITAMAMTAGGGRLVTRQHYLVIVWDTATGERLETIRLRGEEDAGAVAISPDGALLATNDHEAGVAILDADSGEIVERLGPQRTLVNDLAFSPGGRHLAAAAADSMVRVYNVADGTLAAELTGHDAEVYAVAYTGDGRRLASGSEDRTIMLWDVDRATRVLTLSGHDDYVYDLAFSPDDTMLVSASGDGTLRLWDTRPRWQRGR